MTHTVDSRFRSMLFRLDQAGRLLKVRTPVDREFELAGVVAALDGDRGLLFTRVKGERAPEGIPIAANLLVSEANVTTALGLDRQGVLAATVRMMESDIKPVEVTEAPCQEIVREPPFDLMEELPILFHTLGDGGPYITGGIVIARDPGTGVCNASFQRQMVLGPDRLAIDIAIGKHLGILHDRARAAGKPLPVAVVIGTDAAVTYAAATMGSKMPFGRDELSAAGGFKGEPLPVVPCRTVDLVVPAESEIVIEAEILPDQEVDEGPFVEFVGQHAIVDPAPVMRVRAITRRRNPIYYAMLGLGLETTMLRKYVSEATLLQVLRNAAPIVQDVEITPGGLHRFHAVLSVRKQRHSDEGMQRNAMYAAFGALKDLDLIIAVDHDINIHDPKDVEYAIATRFEASKDLILLPESRGHEFIRVSDQGIRTKLGIDATVPFGDFDHFVRVPYRDVNPDQYEVDADAGRLAELLGQDVALSGGR